MHQEPRLPDAAVATPKPATAPPVVLLAEGDADLPGALARMLRREGFTAVTASTCPELVHSTLALRPDVLLCELRLPDGDSAETLRALRARGYRGAAVALTSLKAQTHMGRALASGFDSYLEKPLTLTQLVTTLKTYTTRDGVLPQ